VPFATDTRNFKSKSFLLELEIRAREAVRVLIDAIERALQRSRAARFQMQLEMKRTKYA
jgi:hypothetical protein